MMRATIKYILGLFVWITIYSCYKDKGNYGYTEVNTISITMPDTLIIQQSDTLRVTPELTFATGTDNSRLSYKWEISYPTNSTDSVSEVISTDRNIDEVISYGAGIRYPIAFKVTDMDSGIEYVKKMSLFVISEYQPGFFLLEKKTTNGDISFVNSQKKTVHKNIFSNINPDTPLPNSVRSLSVIDLNSYNVRTVGGDNIPFPFSNKTAVLFENGGYLLDYRDMKVISDYANLFENVPDVIDPTGFKLMTSPNIYTINNGKLHRMIQNQGQTSFGEAYDAPDDLGMYLAPFDGNYSVNNGLFNQFFYDLKNSRFLNVQSNSNTLGVIGGSIFETYAARLKTSEFLVMGYSSQSPQITYLLFRDKAAQKIYMPYIVSYTINIMNEFSDANLLDATVFEWPRQRMQGYYATENRLYLFNSAGNSSRLIYTFPAGEQVTSIRLFRESSSSSVWNLVVATYNGEGKLYTVPIGSDGAMATDVTPEVYTGFGEIVDIAYKAL